MKRILSTALAIALLLSLGGLAVLARPEGANLLSPTGVAQRVDRSALVSAALQGAAEVSAVPDAAPNSGKFNFIALPLDSSASITPFRASGLAAYIGSNVRQVMRWNRAVQGFDTYVPGVSPPFPPSDFDLAVGGAYFLELGSGSTVLSLVGKVPDRGTIVQTLLPGPSPTQCKFNSISIPLDRDDITNAQELATDVGGVSQVMSWNAALQGFNSYVPGVSPPFPPANFDIEIGYPYFLCLNSNGPTTWP
jgi:hypothetical protein